MSFALPAMIAIAISVTSVEGSGVGTGSVNGPCGLFEDASGVLRELIRSKIFERLTWESPGGLRMLPAVEAALMLRLLVGPPLTVKPFRVESAKSLVLGL